jgi:hypothetical protein
MSPGVAVYAYAAIVAAGFAFMLAQIPVQLSDSLNSIGTAFTSSWRDLIVSGFGAKSFRAADQPADQAGARTGARSRVRRFPRAPNRPGVRRLLAVRPGAARTDVAGGGSM